MDMRLVRKETNKQKKNSIPQGIWSTSRSSVKKKRSSNDYGMTYYSRILPEFLSNENIQTNTSFKQTMIHAFRSHARLQS